MNVKTTIKDFLHQPIHKKKFMVGVSSIVVVALAGATLAMISNSQDKNKSKEDTIPPKEIVKQNGKAEQKVDTAHLVDVNNSIQNPVEQENETSGLTTETPSKSTEPSRSTSSTKVSVSTPIKDSVSTSSSNSPILTEMEKEKDSQVSGSSVQETSPEEPSSSSSVSTSSTSGPVQSTSSLYLSASKARLLLENSSYYQKVDNEYFYDDEWGYVVDVKVNPEHVGFIFFDGTTYYSAKNTSYEDVLSFVEGDTTQAEVEWKNLQNVIAENEHAVQLAADSVYGQGTKEANALYQEIIEGGKSSQGYFREF